ncbi:MAG: HRDC domain-containing protein [Aeriscardovia aeriphila]|nr:HRDC domain-containing protein [Aeriscardovia aeriphila]
MQDEPELIDVPHRGVPDLTATSRQFDAAIADLSHAIGPLAVDAERANSYRYSHMDYLIQVRRQGTDTYLFDIPALLAAGCDITRLVSAMPDAEWLLHDASQDLPSFRDLGLFPTKLFDTEFAARFLGLKKAGLASATQKFLGKTLAKEHAIADWSVRPLRRDLRVYAALDVELLIELRDAEEKALRSQGKWEWAQEEFSAILARGLAFHESHNEPWYHTSHISRLGADREGLAIVRELWNTRDKIARKLDINPDLLVGDHTIVEAGLRKPHNRAQFEDIAGFQERVRRHTGTEEDKMVENYAPLQRSVKPRVWLDAILRAENLKEDEWPAMHTHEEKGGSGAQRTMKYWKSHQPERYQRLSAMRTAIGQLSQDLAIPAELLVKPSLIREVCWQEIPHEQIGAFLSEHGARPWQVNLVIKSLRGITVTES